MEIKQDFIYISDFINSFDLILKKEKNKNIYNIGNEQEISIKNLVKK